MLFSNDLRGIERSLDGLSARFQAAAANLANIHTPGYQRQKVDFEDSLKQAMAMSEVNIDPERPMDGPLPDASGFLDAWHPVTQTVERKAQRIDGNGVSLEGEMADVTRTAMKFNLMSSYVASQYRNIKYVIDAR